MRAPGRRGAVTLVVVLGVLALGLSAAALRPPAVVQQRQPDSALVAATPSRTAVWTGPGTCVAGEEDLGRLAVDDGDGFRVVRTPLPNVVALAALDRRLLLAGRNADCRWRVLGSADGGRRWTPVLMDQAVVDVALTAGGGAWVLPADDEDRLLLLDASGGSRTITIGCPDEQRLTDVAAVRTPGAWSLCQDDAGLARVLNRLDAPGGEVERVADDRPEFGLSGNGDVRALAFQGLRTGWLVRENRDCPEGRVLRSDDGGRHWIARPCLGASTGLADVLDVTGVDGPLARVVGLRGGQPFLYRTEDGGATWTQDAPPRVLRGGAS